MVLQILLTNSMVLGNGLDEGIQYGPVLNESVINRVEAHKNDAVFSNEIGAIKPHPDFFLRSFEKFNIDPSCSYYIDDLPENIEAGRSHGLHTHLYSADRHQDLLDWVATH